MNIKYTKRATPDGLGGQIQMLRFLLPFAEKFDLPVICDLRTSPYFRKADYDDRSDQLLEFHPRIIYSSKRIDSIPHKEIWDWADW